ncbi:MAG: EutN/CcmL family microcompartment protein [Proteobacteria bacterium]|nr:EutN/CcmL family microcompartment protein [Pseudomonadota bacterium]MCP4917868.1 EutN/CcmL family microcompartment protein [Pseudomonadota bacterium]
MELARVIGNVVATRKHEALEGVKLLLIQPHDHDGVAQGGPIVAADPIQAGVGDTVQWITGREAALALPQTFVPVDCAIVAIVDDVWGNE